MPDKTKKGRRKSAVFYQICPKSFQDTNGYDTSDYRDDVPERMCRGFSRKKGAYRLP